MNDAIGIWELEREEGQERIFYIETGHVNLIMNFFIFHGKVASAAGGLGAAWDQCQKACPPHQVPMLVLDNQWCVTTPALSDCLLTKLYEDHEMYIDVRGLGQYGERAVVISLSDIVSNIYSEARSEILKLGLTKHGAEVVDSLNADEW